MHTLKEINSYQKILKNGPKKKQQILRFQNLERANFCQFCLKRDWNDRSVIRIVTDSFSDQLFQFYLQYILSFENYNVQFMLSFWGQNKCLDTFQSLIWHFLTGGFSEW